MTLNKNLELKKSVFKDPEYLIQDFLIYFFTSKVVWLGKLVFLIYNIWMKTILTKTVNTRFLLWEKIFIVFFLLLFCYLDPYILDQGPSN